MDLLHETESLSDKEVKGLISALSEMLETIKNTSNRKVIPKCYSYTGVLGPSPLIAAFFCKIGIVSHKGMQVIGFDTI